MFTFNTIHWQCLITCGLQEALNLGVNEFKDGMTLKGYDGKPVAKNTSWTGLRFLLSEVSDYTVAN